MNLDIKERQDQVDQDISYRNTISFNINTIEFNVE